MPVTGRPPKPDDQRITRHPLTVEWIDVQRVPYEGEKPSPGRLPAATKRWWQTVTTMPHCALWEPGDWQFAIDTARIHAAFSKGDLARAQELRVRERVLGTTSDARRDLRIRYVDEQATFQSDAGVPSDLMDLQAERRKRVLGAG